MNNSDQISFIALRGGNVPDSADLDIIKELGSIRQEIWGPSAYPLGDNMVELVRPLPIWKKYIYKRILISIKNDYASTDHPRSNDVVDYCLGLEDVIMKITNAIKRTRLARSLDHALVDKPFLPPPTWKKIIAKRVLVRVRNWFAYTDHPLATVVVECCFKIEEVLDETEN